MADADFGFESRVSCDEGSELVSARAIGLHAPIGRPRQHVLLLAARSKYYDNAGCSREQVGGLGLAV